MRAIEALGLFAVGVVMSGCEASQASPVSDVEPVSGVLDDPDASVQSNIAVTVVADSDASSDAAPAGSEVVRVSTRDGAMLELPPVQEMQAKRDLLAAQIGEDVAAIPTSDLQELRLHWYRGGGGIVLQNPTDHRFRLSAHFESALEPDCNTTVYRASIGPRETGAPTPKRPECRYDSAFVTLFDRYNFVVARATLTGEGE